VLPLEGRLDFDAAREEEFYAAFPARPAVFLVEPRQGGAQPFLGRTANLRGRLERLLRVPGEPSKRLNLREFAAGVRYRVTGSAFEQGFAFYQHARRLFPRRYRDLVRLRPPALLKVNLANEYPRCYVTRRILPDGAFYYGPFPSRKAAEGFANNFLDLFKMRRCQIKIRRDPAFPGCMYSEMKMCLAPCFAGCSKEEYDVEVGRVLSFLASAGGSWTREAEREREAASEALDFERASTAHRKIEKVNAILRGLPELPRKVDELDAVILQPAAEANTVALFAVCRGLICDPFFLRFGELASRPRSAEQILRQILEPPKGADRPREESGKASSDEQAGEERSPEPSGLEALTENLSLVARWFYSKRRRGEIFFPEPARLPGAGQVWPYRRILRACGRVLAPPGPTAPTPES